MSGKAETETSRARAERRLEELYCQKMITVTVHRKHANEHCGSFLREKFALSLLPSPVCRHKRGKETSNEDRKSLTHLAKRIPETSRSARLFRPDATRTFPTIDIFRTIYHRQRTRRRSRSVSLFLLSNPKSQEAIFIIRARRGIRDFSTEPRAVHIAD